MINEKFVAQFQSLNDSFLEIKETLSQNRREGTGIPRHIEGLERCYKSTQKIISSAESVIAERSTIGDGSIIDLTEPKQRNIRRWIDGISQFPEEVEPERPKLPPMPSNSTDITATSASIFDVIEDTEQNINSPITDYTPDYFLPPPRVVPTPTPIESTVTGSTSNSEDGVVEISPPAIEEVNVNIPDLGPDESHIQNCWGEGIQQFKEQNYESAMMHLEWVHNTGRVTDDSRRQDLLRVLALTYAHLGMETKVVETLENYAEAEWRPNVLEILISNSIEEGRQGQATELVKRYDGAFERRDDILQRLVALSIHHGVWQVTLVIFQRHRQFKNRERLLRNSANSNFSSGEWNAAEGFLLELLGGQKKDTDAANTAYRLAEVYVEKKELKSARTYIESSMKLRQILYGPAHPNYLAAVYFLSRIIYEDGGEYLDYKNYRNKLQWKNQGHSTWSLLT